MSLEPRWLRSQTMMVTSQPKGSTCCRVFPGHYTTPSSGKHVFTLQLPHRCYLPHASGRSVSDDCMVLLSYLTPDSNVIAKSFSLHMQTGTILLYSNSALYYHIKLKCMLTTVSPTEGKSLVMLPLSVMVLK